jgi:endonuclease/exonuclease/phosphatase family metal-dependent hydrolase
MRVGTWNVQYGRGSDLNDRRRRVMQSRDADVWVLTETHDELDLSATHYPVRSPSRFRRDQASRWVTIWTRFPVLQALPTADPSRCVAVRLDGGSAAGDVIIYGTVLPWYNDAGPDAAQRAKGWSEFYRVTPEQGADWKQLRISYPASSLIVAGDLNHNLGGAHHYGTRRGRQVLRDALGMADLVCLTETEFFSPGRLRTSPIDHICASPRAGLRVCSQVVGWERTDEDGIRLSDHGGVLAAIEWNETD